MKEIEELTERLRNEMVTRMDDSDIVNILVVLEKAEEEIDNWQQSHDKIARALEKANVSILKLYTSFIHYLVEII